MLKPLTNLYNARPTWLHLAHKRLDPAVFAVYGWPADLTGEQILTRLLALNLERANKRPNDLRPSDTHNISFFVFGDPGLLSGRLPLTK